MKLIPEAVSRQIALKSLQVQHSSPKLLLGAGVASMIGSTILACRATLRLEEVLQKGQNDLRIARSISDDNYTENDRQHDVTLIYIQTAGNVMRLYAPAVFLGVGGVAALTKSHNILNERNAALTAAYAALEKGFNEYRERVVEKYGEEEDRKLRYGTREIENPDPKKKDIVLRADPSGPSIYARFFDWNSSSWNGEFEYNLIFLRCQQNYANDLLKARGHVFLNDVYDMLGLERSSAGAVVGWVLNGVGDNYIDFGCFDDQDQVIDFMIGDDNEILLDFNVDGVVYDQLDKVRNHSMELMEYKEQIRGN